MFFQVQKNLEDAKTDLLRLWQANLLSMEVGINNKELMSDQ